MTLNTRLCRLTVWADEAKLSRLEEIDLMGATFTYDLENTQGGQFKIRSDSTLSSHCSRHRVI